MLPETCCIRSRPISLRREPRRSPGGVGPLTPLHWPRADDTLVVRFRPGKGRRILHDGPHRSPLRTGPPVLTKVHFGVRIKGQLYSQRFWVSGIKGQLCFQRVLGFLERKPCARN